MSEVTTFEIPEGTMAMTTDDGIVVTLLQRDPEKGAVVRHDGEWVEVTDPETLDGLNFVGVAGSAVDLFDTHEADGHLVPVQYYPASEEGPFWPDPVVVEDENLEFNEETGEFSSPADEEDADKPVTASVMINSADDLDAAIAAAAMDPDLRWYVERRCKALGLEASLPWLKD